MNIIRVKNIGTYAIITAVVTSAFILMMKSIFTGVPIENGEETQYAAQGVWANQWIAIATIASVFLNAFIAIYVARTYRLSEKNGEIETRAYPILNINSVKCDTGREYNEVIIEGHIKNYGQTVAVEGITSVIKKAENGSWAYNVLTLTQKEWSIAPSEEVDFFLHIKSDEIISRDKKYSVFIAYNFKTIFRRSYRFIDEIEFYRIRGVNGPVGWSLLRKENLQ